MIAPGTMRIGLVMLLLALSGNGAAAMHGPYSIKSDIVVPPGAAPGQFRRYIHPFSDWTLICDENLADLSKVCNVTQTLQTADGVVVFSWSLAASEDGKPIFILRVAPSVGADGVINIRQPGGEALARVPVRACDERVCVGTMRPNAEMLEQVDRASQVIVSFEDGHLVRLKVPLSGLKEAVAAID